jgi:hypothetical protein
MSHPQQLSASVFLYKPDPATDDAPDSEGPRLVILATWAFAHHSHIAKYVAGYKALFPSATILVLKAFLRHMFWIPAARQELMPAVSVIRSVLSHLPNTKADAAAEADSETALILHVFSNTGLGTSYNLYEAYAEATAGLRPSDQVTAFPQHATIFDSTPGRYEYWSVASAVMYAVPKSRVIQRLVLLPFAHMLSSGLWVWVRLLHRQDWVASWARAANDGGRIREVCRSYAYSDADELVESSMVEQHARLAKQQGFRVLHVHNFGTSEHVAHARSDPKRYWDSVDETWKKSINRST